MNGPAPRLLRLLVLGTLSTMAVLAACSSPTSSNGEASKSARQIYSDAERATESALSVHISGLVTSGGAKIGLDYVDSSKRSGGTISDNGATFQIILSGKTAYIKGSKETMTKVSGDAAAGQLLGGRWLKTTVGNKDFGSLTAIFNLPNLIHSIQPHGPLRKDSVTTINGQSVIGLTDTALKGTLYVANTGRPYMIKLVGGPGEPGTITFDRYGSATPPALPTGAINLDQLEGGSSA
jgi:hypothetical protein